MITFEQNVCVHPDSVDTELEGQETVLLHLKTKLYYSLNPTGTRIWQGLKRGWTLRQISAALQQEFDVDPLQADHSVLALVDELCEQQLARCID